MNGQYPKGYWVARAIAGWELFVFKNMKNIFKTLGIVFIVFGIIMFFVLSFVVTGNQGESFARDLFGLPIPHPAVWVSLIPYIGSLLSFILEFFSLHGLVEVIIIFILMYIGGIFLVLAEKNK